MHFVIIRRTLLSSLIVCNLSEEIVQRRERGYYSMLVTILTCN
jgi:hypothetical protein